MRSLRFAFAGLRHSRIKNYWFLLLSGIFLFLLVLLFNLQNIQSSFYSQLNDRLALAHSSADPIAWSNFSQIHHWYTWLLLFCMILYIGLLYAYRRSYFKEKHWLEWRLSGISFKQLFFLSTWQILIPLAILSVAVFGLLLLFQQSYESLIQTIQLFTVHEQRLTQVIPSTSTYAALTIPFDQQSLFSYQFTDRMFLLTIGQSWLQAVGCLFVSTFLVNSFLFYRRKKAAERRGVDDPQRL